MFGLVSSSVRTNLLRSRPSRVDRRPGSLCVAGFWNVVYVEDSHFALDTLRVASRSPSPTSKTNDLLLGLFDDVWGSAAAVPCRFGCGPRDRTGSGLHLSSVAQIAIAGDEYIGLLNRASGRRAGLQGRFWVESLRGRTKIRSQTARVFGPGNLDPDFGPSARALRRQNRPKTGPGTQGISSKPPRVQRRGGWVVPVNGSLPSPFANSPQPTRWGVPGIPATRIYPSRGGTRVLGARGPL